MGDFLQSIGNGPHHNIAAQPWRVGPKEPPPFQTQVCETEFSKTAMRSEAWPSPSGAFAAMT